MKLHAQEILQFSGYPLEPIVALEVKKTYEEKIKEAVHRQYFETHLASPTSHIAHNSKNWDTEWYGNYE